MAGRRDPDALNQREFAFCVAYVGTAEGNQTEAARLAGYKGSDATLNMTGSRLMTRDKVRAYIQTLNDQQAKKGVLLKANRLARRQLRWEQINAEFEARAKQQAAADSPTARTGIIGQEPRANGAVLWAADTALLREEREIEKQVAIELGEWTEQTSADIKIHGEAVPIVEVVVTLDDAGRERAKAEEDELDRIEWDGPDAAADAEPGSDDATADYGVDPESWDSGFGDDEPDE